MMKALQFFQMDMDKEIKYVMKNNKKYRFTYIKTTLFTLFVSMLFVDGYTPFQKTGENFFRIQLNGQDVGTVESRERAEELLIEARRSIAEKSDELVFMEARMEIAGEEILWGKMDDEQDVLENMEAVLSGSVVEAMHRSYSVKVNDYMANLASLEEVVTLLQAAVDKYDTEGKFRVELAYDADREFSVLTTNVVDTTQAQEEEEAVYTSGGVETLFQSGEETVQPEEEKDFDDYDLGILDMDFSEKMEVVEVYLPESLLTPLEEAVNEVVMEQETPSVYKVVQGDTLSEIAIKVNIPIDKIIEMNDSLEDENTTLQIDQELIITVPEPELSVTRLERNYYEESYDAEVEIIDVDTWYTNQTEVLQQPSAGFRKVVADVSFVNDKEVSREILKEEIVMEAVPKIMKRGTKIPPNYIRPIRGGRLSSGFGKRPRPKRGASTNHKGVDWATPTGTAVYASCGGTVARAGWGSGYGYVVYIDHGDGCQTRYAHLSKVLVSAGQSVRQGDKIALSGNTGNSTGPHLHFEILINGTQVNPLKHVPQ